MKKTLKYILYTLIILFIILILFLMTSHYGNPITRIKAYIEIKEYAKIEFDDFEYSLDHIKYDSKLNLYYVKLNIPNSEDKDFYINYKEGEIFDDREMVSSKANIINRIQPLLNDVKYDKPVQTIFKDNLNFCFLTLYNEEWDKVEYDITLEEFLKKYKLQLSIYINHNINNESEIITELQQEFKKMDITLEKITIAAI